MTEPQQNEPVQDQIALAQQPAGAETERFETIDYVRELFLNSEEQKKNEKKRLRLLTVCACLLSAMALAVVVSCALLVPAGLRAVNEVTTVAETVSKIDLDGLVTTVNDFSEQADETFVSVSEAVSVLDELDMESLNGAISQLKTTVEQFSQLDIATLNTAIQNLNDTVEPFANFFAKFK